MTKLTFAQEARVLREPILAELTKGTDSPLIKAMRINPQALAELIYRQAQSDTDRFKALAMTGAQQIAERQAKRVRRRRC